MAYKHIVFDIGNVLLNYKPQDYLSSKIKDPCKVIEVYKEVFLSKEWLMLDRGTITEEEAKNILISRSPENGQLIELAFENWYEALSPIEGTIEVLNDLKKAGYKVYYLSNFQLLAFKDVIIKNDFFKIFDGGIASFKEKLLKPEEEIYKRILEKYQMIPEESIFIDDTKENIEAAQKLKFKTILFKNPEDLRSKLKACGVYL